MLMSASDLSGSTKLWSCHSRLSKLVSNEFFQQGDLEKEKFNGEPMDMMNRAKEHQLPQMQIQFLQSICLPLYKSIAQCQNECNELVKNCEANIEEWKKLIK
jgi:dual 3',5'-cyclic-AMP and -GMP phosphodiesterase 11